MGSVLNLDQVRLSADPTAGAPLFRSLGLYRETDLIPSLVLPLRFGFSACDESTARHKNREPARNIWSPGYFST